MASLLCEKHVRSYALNATSAKARGFTRLSPQFLDRIEARLKQIIQQEVQTHPTLGQTLK